MRFFRSCEGFFSRCWDFFSSDFGIFVRFSRWCTKNFFIANPLGKCVAFLFVDTIYLSNVLTRSVGSECLKLALSSAEICSGHRTADRMKTAAAAAAVSRWKSSSSCQATGIMSRKASSCNIVALLMRTSNGAWNRSIVCETMETINNESIDAIGGQHFDGN